MAWRGSSPFAGEPGSSTSRRWRRVEADRFLQALAPRRRGQRRSRLVARTDEDRAPRVATRHRRPPRSPDRDHPRVVAPARSGRPAHRRRREPAVGTGGRRHHGRRGRRRVQPALAGGRPGPCTSARAQGARLVRRRQTPGTSPAGSRRTERQSPWLPRCRHVRHARVSRHDSGVVRRAVRAAAAHGRAYLSGAQSAPGWRDEGRSAAQGRRLLTRPAGAARGGTSGGATEPPCYR